MKFKKDILFDPRVVAFVEEHIDEMLKHSPPESKHALDIEGLNRPEIEFWTLWDNDQLQASGAIQKLTSEQVEIKAMRTAVQCRGKGLGQMVLTHLIERSKALGFQSIQLETGSMEAFLPARELYIKNGFSYTGPFADYTMDPNSVFMQLEL